MLQPHTSAALSQAYTLQKAVTQVKISSIFVHMSLHIFSYLFFLLFSSESILLFLLILFFPLFFPFTHFSQPDDVRWYIIAAVPKPRTFCLSIHSNIRFHTNFHQPFHSMVHIYGSQSAESTSSQSTIPRGCAE